MIGMAGRFPGAPDVPTLWENLRNGVESFAEITDEDIANSGYHKIFANHPDYVRVRPVLDDIKGFDAGFFGYSPREAAVADPQQRIFLECVHEALEGAGYGRAGERGRVGIFAGNNVSTYMIDRFNDPETLLRVDPYEMIIGNDKDALTTVVAYRLDLTGPAVSVQTFCSTSAVAIHMACQSLRRNECEMAVAGGVCVRVPDRIGHVYVEGGMASPDGHIRTFDAKAQGGIFGDGSAAVLLKPLRKAIADRDHVLAVIRGSAMNNDGAAKFSYTAPSVVGQSTAVADALADADVAPADVSYVEAHGTATELGDPIEVAALTRAFRAAEVARSGADLRDRQYCAVGSVKTNIGHLDRAATIAGMVKVVEALRHELIPKSLNYESPNPEIDFERSPFYVAGDPVPWPRQSGRPRIAGLNGLGMGGTNVHIVLQEAPEPAPRTANGRSWQVLPLSAKTESAAATYCERMATHLGGDHQQELGDVAYTLQVGRTLLPHRRVVVASDAGSAASAFGMHVTPDANLLARQVKVRGTRSSFLFAGVGEHYAGMVAELYRTEPNFRLHLDEGQKLLSAAASLEVVPLLTGERQAGAGTNDLAALLGRRTGEATGPSPFSDTRVAQTGVFLAEYALARTLMDWGVAPDLVLGYSVGEYVAACLAGVLTLPDAVRLVAHRADLIAGMPPGAMLAVGKTWEELSALRADLAERDIDLAAITPGQVVVGGPTAAVAELAVWLRENGVVCRELDTTHAFHTRMLEPVAAELTRWIADNITLHPPTLPYVSNVTGELATAELVTDPGYWAEHMCRPVQFSACLATAFERTSNALLEIGPGRSLGAMARSHPECDRARWPFIIATMPGAGEDSTSGARALATALAELWLNGVDVDWAAYHQTNQVWCPGRVPLPTYPFERQPYWFNEDTVGGTPLLDSGDSKSREEMFSEYAKLPLLPERQWLNLQVWRERAPKPPMTDPGSQWVVFTDEGRADALAGPIVEAFHTGEAQVTLVRPGAAYGFDGEGYRIRPGNIEDTLDLFAALKERGCVPDRVVHMWTLSGTSATEDISRGLHTLVAIARAAHEVGFGDWKLDVVTAGTFQVTGDEPIVPARATTQGPCTILPVEYAGAAVRLVDLRDDAPAPVGDVLAELRTDPGNQIIALRSGRRWIPDFDVLELTDADEEPPVPTGRFREGGVYLVTGGLGGIGMALAERIADTYRGKLVLFGRTPVPARESWDEILADPTVSAEVRRRIEGLRHFESKGIEFELVSGDVSDVEAVRRAVEAARTRFGALHGVLHAAGVPALGMMQFKTVDDMNRVLASKVGGTLALAEVLRDEPLDFLVLFSSVASWTGALGQADYSAANSFLDAFARSGALPQAKVVSIGWGEWTWNGWADGLEGYEPVLRELYIHHRKVFGIGFDAGWRCLQQILDRPEPYLVVNTQDFAASVEGSRSYTVHDLQAGARKGRGEARYPRPDLSTPFLAPSNETEATIADLWAEWIGIEQVGLHDNFFDLGGNSLIGVGLMDAIRRALDLDHLPAHLLYQAPTVSALAATVTSTKEEPTKQESGDARAAQRQQRLARRRANVKGSDNE
ncbi:SDR family NAD(P)-dependent oxidoreductase [Micromonospora sp. NPDC049047]|uniref:type I polyketide synthase n=1 Tax=Micromonospora sp. NPDC049047 TaxID=3155645 RepID=UPI003407F03F